MDTTIAKAIEILDSLSAPAIVDEWRWSQGRLHLTVDEEMAVRLVQCLLAISRQVLVHSDACEREALRRAPFDLLDNIGRDVAATLAGTCPCREGER